MEIKKELLPFSYQIIKLFYLFLSILGHKQEIRCYKILVKKLKKKNKRKYIKKKKKLN